jgi:hypothetical protein
MAVINPSLFEGWSSTVEECKSIGKNMILSDIPIHKEQNPPDSLYFEPNNAEALSKLLQDVWLSDIATPNLKLEQQASNILEKRTLDFANTYKNIVWDLYEK